MKRRASRAKGLASRMRELPGSSAGGRRRTLPAHPAAYADGAPARRGSTLVIVIALLAIMALLAIVFYTFAAQERSNAEYYAEAAKARQNQGLSADIYFNWSLRQLIIGPRRSEVNSALWSGRASMVPNILGYVPNQNPAPPAGSAAAQQPFLPEAHPYNGEGTNLIVDASGNPRVDQNYDGSPDNARLLDYNLSPVARNGLITPLNNPTDLSRWPQPDVDYTYPDINNLFLAYDGYALQGNGRRRRVIIPSFHRPQYLRQFAQWWGNPQNPGDTTTAGRLFRPHPSHRDAASAGRNLLYVRTQAEATSLGFVKPFPFRPVDGQGNATGGQMGIWTNSAETTYNLDVDNDLDPAGIREGVWLYLGFPLQELPDGTQFVPMHSFTVYDADALLNLSVHGNSAVVDNMQIDPNTPFAPSIDPNTNRPTYLSKSLQGLDPAEINPQWGLHATPVSLPSIYAQFFGRNPQTHEELANMEYFFLTRGRPEFSSGQGTQSDVSDLFPGRYGEPNVLFNALRQSPGTPMAAGNFPKAGQTGIDDQQNSPWEESLETPPFGHPLAYNGLGRYTRQNNFKQVNLLPPLTGNPSVWPAYANYHLRNAPLLLVGRDGQPGRATVDDDGNGTVDRFPNGALDLAELGAPGSDDPPRLVRFFRQRAQFDDAMETIFDRRQAQRPDDEIFGADETAKLQLTRTQLDAQSLTLRSEQLMPFSFQDDSGEYDTRRRFTADSWNRKQYGFPRRSRFREWEWWDRNQNGALDAGDEFPPRFSGPDPFRPALRQLLRVRFGRAQATSNPQFRLDVNRLLERLANGRLRFRELRPHDANLTATSLSQQEVAARRDRQLSARDVYVLLYTLGGGNDSLDYTQSNAPDPNNNNQRPLYTDQQLAEMAQFAVNLVDFHDRDDVITRFEYDRDLSDGWNLDDNSDTVDTGLGNNRGVAFGVEAQQLTFSEGLWIQVPKQISNHTETFFDEINDEHHFAYIELRNASPMRVPLATSASIDGNTGIWRIRRDDGTNLRVTFLQNAGLGGIGAPIPGGGQFTIGTSNAKRTLENEFLPSDFRVDHDNDQTFELIAPNVADPNPPNINTTQFANYPRPRTDLDLVHKEDADPGRSKFHLNAGRGGFLTELNAPQNGKLRLILERRLNPRLPRLANQNQSQNPWVEVDEIEISLTQFNLDSAKMSGAPNPVLLELAKLKSTERREPFFRPELQYTGNGPVRFNSLGRPRNSVSPAQFRLWQPHFDRDLPTIGELLTVPLYGPQDVTTRLKDPVPANNRPDPNAMAGGKFLRPDFPDAVNPDPQLDNRWYRLLELVEVGTRTHRHQQFGNPLNQTRVPGQLQLNTLRHPEALAGLIDDTNFARFAGSYLADPDTTQSYLPRPFDARDFWKQFIQARDQLDTFSQLNFGRNLYLPGTPDSRPFRSLAFAARGNQSLGDTLLRPLPFDVQNNPANPRHLLEIGSANEHQNGSIDAYVRDSLLSKVIGNTTTRSHVFVVFVSVDFFEAREVNGGLKIGGRLDDTSVEHRGVFVVDRSQIEEMIDPQTGRIDPEQWAKLIQYRLTIK